MPEGELYLIRHAEAAGADGEDPGLSDRGREQARALGTRLSAGRFTGVLHSPRRRAAETAQLLSDHLPQVPVGPCDLIGDLTPVPSEERQDDYPFEYRQGFDAVPAGERDENGAALSHAVSELSSAAVRSVDGRLILVTHAFVVGWFVRDALDCPPRRWVGLHPAPTGLTVLRYSDAGPRLIAFNDTGHLLPPPPHTA